MAKTPLSTNERLRRHVKWMVFEAEYPQNKIAAAMGIHPSKLNRWIHDPTAKPLDVNAMDAYERFIAKLGMTAGPALRDDEPFRSPAPGTTREKTGT